MTHDLPTFESSAILVRRELLDIIHTGQHYIELTSELKFLEFIVSHTSVLYPTEEALQVALPPFTTEGTLFLFSCKLHCLRQIQHFWFDRHINKVGTMPNGYRTRARRCEEAATFQEYLYKAPRIQELHDTFCLGIPEQTCQIVATH